MEESCTCIDVIVSSALYMAVAMHSVVVICLAVIMTVVKLSRAPTVGRDK